MKRPRALPLTLVIMLGLAMAFPVLSWVSWARAPALGVVGDQLTPCPNSPNAVSSQAQRPDQQVAPLEFEGDPAKAMRELASILGATPRTKIVRQTENYLRAECVTPLMRFVDDIEFVVGGEQRVIHVRSASRVGYSDMGTNRKRVERIRAQFAERAV